MPHPDWSDDNLITESRFAKGDLEVCYDSHGNISRAIPANLTIIKELVRRNIFPFHYEIYGVGFIEMRNVFRSPWAAKSSAVLLEQWGEGISTTAAGDIYQAVTRLVGKQKISVIEHVVDEPKEREMANMHLVYKMAFDRLVEVMDTERDRALKERGIL